MKLEFSMHRPEDEDQLVEFWNQNSGWGALDKAAWRHKFMDTPMGDSSFALATEKDNGALVAQFGFVPSQVSVFGEKVLAYRPVAIMLREDIRQNRSLIAVPKLILQLYNFATDKLQAQGIGLIHMLPDHRWARLFKMVPNFKLITFPLYRLPLPLVAPLELHQNFSVQPLSYEDAAIDTLWECAKTHYPCIVWRDRSTLKWKNSLREFKLWGLYRGDHLAGLFAVYKKDRNRKWQICDVLSEDQDDTLRNLLVAACREGQRSWEAQPEDEKSLQEVEIFPSNLMVPMMEPIGFQSVKYKFSLVVHQLDKTLPAELSDPSNWYFSPNE